MKRLLYLAVLSIAVMLVFAPAALAQETQRGTACAELVPGNVPAPAQEEAQARLDENPSDPNNFDADGDGIACEYTGSSVRSGIQFEDGSRIIAGAGAASQPQAQQEGNTVTQSFELAVEGEPPADATFFGVTAGAGEGSIYVQLTDPDGDGVYTGSSTLNEIQSEATQISILQGTGTEPCADGSGTCPGEPITVLKDFGLVEPSGTDRTFSANASVVGQTVVGPIVDELGADFENLLDQRCTQILNSIQAAQFTQAGELALDEDLAAATAQRYVVSTQAVQDCAERYNAGELPAANPGGGVGELPDTGGPALLLPVAGLLLASGLVGFAALRRRR